MALINDSYILYIYIYYIYIYIIYIYIVYGASTGSGTCLLRLEESTNQNSTFYHSDNLYPWFVFGGHLKYENLKLHSSHNIQLVPN